MSIELGGIALHPYLLVPDWPVSSLAAGSERRTLGQRLVVQRRVMPAPDLITLTAVRDGNGLYGYFTHAQIGQFREFRDAGDAVLFYYHGTEMMVVIPVGGIQVEPVFRRTDPPADLPYVGTITLRGV